MGFMPPAYYGTTGGLSYGSSPAAATSYNSIPQHAQDVNNFDRSSDEAAAADATAGRGGGGGPKGQGGGYLDYYDVHGFIAPSDGNDIHIASQATGGRYAIPSSVGSQQGNQYPNNAGQGGPLLQQQGISNSRSQLGLQQATALQNQGHQYAPGYGFGGYDRNGLAGSYSSGMRRPYQSPCSKGILNPILTLGTLAGLLYGAYQFVTWLGRDDKRKRSSTLGADWDLFYSPLMYGTHI